MIVIIGTNIWISDLALASNAGSAVRFYLRQRNARIGLPEVVRLVTFSGGKPSKRLIVLRGEGNISNAVQEGDWA